MIIKTMVFKIISLIYTGYDRYLLYDWITSHCHVKAIRIHRLSEMDLYLYAIKIDCDCDWIYKITFNTNIAILLKLIIIII